MDDIIDEMAKMIVKENEAYLGREIVQESVKDITNSRKTRNENEEKAKEKEGERTCYLKWGNIWKRRRKAERGR